MPRHAILGRRSIEDDTNRQATLLGQVGGSAGPHALLSSTHSDTVTAAPTRGGLIFGNATPAWDLLPIGASGRYLRSDGTDLAWATIPAGDLPALRGTPNLTFSTTNAQGSAATYVATDATIALFDATNPTTIDAGDTASPGSAGTGARRDHAHAVNSTADGETNVSTLLQSNASGYLRLARLGLGKDPAVELDVQADNSTAAMRLRQDGSGDLLEFYDGSTLVGQIYSSGRIYMNATTETSGAMLHLYRNKTSANTDAYVCLLINQESGDDKGVLQINNYGAAPGLYVISYSGHEAVQAWRNQSGASEPVVQVNQYHASGGTEVLRLTQGDVDQPFARVHGTAAAGDLTRSLVDYGDESSSTAQVWIKVYVQDDGNQVTDQAVFLLGYTLA